MLIQFAVSNFLSFREEVVLSMVASPDKEHPSHVLVESQGKETRLLRGAAIYGANASGKSNLIQAVEFAKRLILTGTQPDAGILAIPFRLDEKSPSRPSRFEFLFKHLGVIYTYGFVVDASRVHEEWLFATFSRKEVLLFERKGLKVKSRYEFGNSLAKKGSWSRQFLSFIAQGTRDNQLFLTEAYARDVTKIKPVVTWFREVLTIISARSAYLGLEATAAVDSRFVDFVGDFLRAAGTGVDGISTVSTPVGADEEMSIVPPEVWQKVTQAFAAGRRTFATSDKGRAYAFVAGREGQPVLVKLRTRHLLSNGKFVNFDLADESDGTQRLIHLLPALFNMRSRQSVYLIDELDRTLHPLLSRMFVKSFLELDGLHAVGQLIFTTHDTTLLDLELVRRDEVWFVAKDENGCSEIYSLNDFNIRKDLVIQKGYLNGRFGAIPFLGDPSRLGVIGNDKPTVQRAGSNGSV